MLTDLNYPALIEDSYSGYDAPIIGLDAAGIKLALKLSAKGKKVALIEAGGLEWSEESQQIYNAKTVGDPYLLREVITTQHFQ